VFKNNPTTSFSPTATPVEHFSANGSIIHPVTNGFPSTHSFIPHPKFITKACPPNS
jgi:hypothetical protein